MLRQFDVFRHPIVGVRHTFPLIAILQSEISQSGIEVIAAPLSYLPSSASRVVRTVPTVAIESRDYLVFVPLLGAIRSRGLGRSIASIEPDRDAILTALDYLFFGI